ncbi:alpha-hydroxy acid oxidase [Celeribacter indicus]|uniref:S-mandelate dehydrogenase (MdlB) n=1 Tax=Celeribacter indicus TaxID=1208324 RepID=A0A0B5E5S8_9RHOB|nr:alpha-hydroxy acid oxidase [Celeribacter indicus]AJE47682.1 S-mandelate dehydrogenase (MdlB) [Celeribacter indicus]SDW14158.1 (S)-mandelate dehydrogenase [Celeribacter indicus]
MKMKNAVNIDDLRRLARRRLPRVVFDYLDGGAEDELTLRANRRAFDDLTLRPRLLGGGRVDLSTEIFGQSYSAPFLIGPTGLSGIYWPEGDLHLAGAAAEAGIGFALSTGSNASMETIARRIDAPRWFQLYPWGGPEFSEALVERAAAAGYSALILTLDSLVGGKRERDLRHGFSHEIRMSAPVVLDGLMHPRWLASVWFGRHRPRFENLIPFLGDAASDRDLAEFTRSQRNPHFSWEDVRRIRGLWPGPLLIKGVMCAEDAIRARAEGADGIVVSNHGGRQLDGAPASLSVLPEIVAALDEGATVLLDGGIRRGSDIVKALALGAQGVLLGRAPLYGLAAGGREGVARALAILADEMQRTMILTGCDAPRHLGRDHLALRTDPPPT